MFFVPRQAPGVLFGNHSQKPIEISCGQVKRKPAESGATTPQGSWRKPLRQSPKASPASGAKAAT